MKRFLVITGLPASGKSTVGAALSTALGLLWLDKDEILEALFDGLGVGDADWRRRLSRSADLVLQRLALGAPGAVISSWWQHPSSPIPSGTPVITGVPTVAGTFNIIVRGSDGVYTEDDPITFVINPGIAAPPQITTQPVAQAVNAGTTVTFTVVATGSHSSVSGWRTSADRRVMLSRSIPPAIRIEPSSRRTEAWKLRGS